MTARPHARRRPPRAALRRWAPRAAPVRGGWRGRGGASRRAVRRAGWWAALGAGAGAWWPAGGSRQAAVALAFAGVVTLGEVLRVDEEGAGHDGAPLATAAALGYALLGPHGGAGVVRAVGLALAATAAGTLIRPHGRPDHRRTAPLVPPRRVPDGEPRPAARLPHQPRHAARGGPRDPLAATVRLARRAPARFRAGFAGVAGRRMVGVGVAAVCSQPVAAHGELRAVCLLGVVAVVAGWDVVLSGAGAPGDRAAVGAGAVVLALGAGSAGAWAVPLVGVTLLVTQVSLRGHAAVRGTYRATVASLARATEVAGYTPPGHARRVSALATAVGRELGLTARRLRALEHAALMHDIGQLSLVDPLPYGATEPLDDERRREVAALGVEVVRRTGAPPDVVLVVERQAHPYREQPLAGRIVRVANAYEDLSGAAAAGPQPLHTRLAAVERMRLATAYDYDPRVVDALTRVLARQSGRAWLDAGADGKEDG